MLYKFRSRATADVIMLGPSGDQVLTVLGKPKGEAGIVRWSEAHAAINRLRAAVEAEEDAQRVAERDAIAAGKTLKLDQSAISLRQRVQPLIEMLQRASKEEVDVTWGD